MKNAFKIIALSISIPLMILLLVLILIEPYWFHIETGIVTEVCCNNHRLHLDTGALVHNWDATCVTAEVGDIVEYQNNFAFIPFCLRVVKCFPSGLNVDWENNFSFQPICLRAVNVN